MMRRRGDAPDDPGDRPWAADGEHLHQRAARRSAGARGFSVAPVADAAEVRVELRVDPPWRPATGDTRLLGVTIREPDWTA